MTRTIAQRRRRFAASIAPLLVVLGALPLMAPTCGDPGEGFKTFSRNSLIIPMDVCYQYQTDGVQTSYTPSPAGSCPQAVDPGSVIKAYGLVYQLIRNGIAVYWVIDNAKTALNGIDLSIQYNGGVPVFFYDWATGAQTGAPTSNPSNRIDYRGGPFIVDGSDYARASAVLQAFKSTFQPVNVHVSNVAFRGYAKRTMAGGWSAGGSVPPKLALLDIGSSGAGSKNSEFVIEGYLAQAGLNTAGAAGTATGTHGQIYDKLFMPDFIPTVAGDWTRTTLHANGYQILWVPHWAAPTSCSDCPAGASCNTTNCNNTRYDPVTITSALKTIGSFVGAGGDVFAECAGLGSFEGVPGDATYGTGADPDTHFQETAGVGINGGLGAALIPPGNFSSPLMQLGDYPFIPRTGAIQRYKPAVSSAYRAGVQRLIEDASSTAYDIFTLLPRAGARGSVVYLGGHTYSGNDGAFEVAGSRLVLNTLFNLGAGCTATGIACNTGLLGVCAAGTYVCQNGQPVCVATVQPGTQPEICNGLDDNCDGSVDEGLQTDCYDPPPGYVDPDGRSTTAFAATRNVGVCRPGVSSCMRNPDGSYAMTACVGQVLPSPETCNGLDDDCNGTVDEGLSRSCYDGTAGTINVGTCQGGTQVCQNGAWGAIVGAAFDPGICGSEVLPVAEICGNGKDDNCNGSADEGCGCAPGDKQSCFTGPGTFDAGVCHTGIQTCNSLGAWDPCPGGTTEGAAGTQRIADLVNPEPCVASTTYVKTADTNCDGHTTKCPDCQPGQIQSCFGTDPTFVPTAAGRGQCAWGTRSCGNGTWDACTGYILPSAAEYCDGKDNRCNGARVASPHPAPPTNAIVPAAAALPGFVVDVSPVPAVCPPSFTCLRGVCVPAACGAEQPAPEGYTCSGGVLVPGGCGTVGAPGCAVGAVCQYGNCIDPCPVSSTVVDPDTLQSVSLVCGDGTVCGGGACIGGGCYETGCAAGQLCQAGSCVTDPCAGVACPSGTFCRQGFCVQACTFVSCAIGQKCGMDGFCVADQCAGRTCNPGERCSAGVCAADPCIGMGCAPGQICQPSSTGAATCADDPCAGIDCPAGVCVRGQCFATGNLTGVGTLAKEAASPRGCGCGSGGGVALPALLALLAAPFFRRRRPRRAGGAGGSHLALLLVAVALVASGCKSTKKDFDPSTCQQTCGEQRCVDTMSDPGHCGVCTTACNSGEQCVDAVCGPSTAVAPYISGPTPSSGPKDDATVGVDLAGERFQAGATVRIATPLGTLTSNCPAAVGGDCWWVSASKIHVQLDLTGMTLAQSRQPWQLRVVNPNNVISNAVTFAVVVPVPAIASVTPTSALAGGTATLAVQGTGFTTGSQCRLQGQGVNDLGLDTALQASGELQCFLDAATVPAGAYQLSVMSEDGVRSNLKPFSIGASDPVVYAVDPNSAVTGVVTLTVTGARFDATSSVYFDAIAVPTTDHFSTTTLSASNFALRTTTGNHTITVRNGAGPASNGVTFTVGGSPPSITSFTPPTAYQGDPSVVMTFTGTGFPSDSVLELEPAGASTFVAQTSTTGGCAGTCTTVSATRSLVGAAAGTWQARVRLGPAGSATTPPWPLQVLSNQAILRGYTAAPDPQQSGTVGSTKTSLTFQVANIHGPAFGQVKVEFRGPTSALVDPLPLVTTLDPNPDPTAASTTLFIPGGLSLAGLDSGTYTFAVVNPNATASNALPFTVNPGPPTLTSVCVNGTNCTATTTQSNIPVRVRLAGTNFAKPDASGNGSTVMVASAIMPGWPGPDPCGASTVVVFEPAPVTSVTVNSSTDMVVDLDTRGAYADPSFGTTYYIGVWNPSAGAGPQKSSCGVVLPSTLPWFKILP